MADLILEGIEKRFDNVPALSDINATIKDGEFVALLGPSGCGKSTMLRLLAGFEQPSQGRIQIGQQEVANAQTGKLIAPEDRNIGFVFQSYALWPHMNVRRNISFPLEVGRCTKKEIEERTNKALAITELTDYADRAPSDLSGGQRQRVALARALVLDPAAILLDEPLANLDVALRASMQDVFIDLHRRNKATMVYVTHDQSEAMAMADRIAVISEGRIIQFDTPEELYNRPRNPFVADFVGEGCVVPVSDVRHQDGAIRARLLGADISVQSDISHPNLICLRPENLTICEEGDIRAKVVRANYLGGKYRLSLKSPCNQTLTLMAPHRYDEGTQLGLSITQPWGFQG